MERYSGHDDKKLRADETPPREPDWDVDMTDAELAEADHIDDFSEDLFLLASESKAEHMKPEVERRLAEFHRRHDRENHSVNHRWLISLVAVAATVACIVWWYNPGIFSSEGQEWVAFMPDSIPSQVVLESDESGSAGVVDWKTLMAAVPNRTNELDYCRMTDLVMPSDGQEVHHTLSVPCGETFKVTLSDGTEVMLNAGSRLTYPVHFTKAERKVKLEGEAFFKVAKDAAHPFIVEAGRLRTRVLGTSFNVSAYPNMQPSVTLFEGCVEADGGTEASAVRMEPGMSVCWNNQKAGFDVSKVDLETEALWRKGYFYYDNVRLEDILVGIGRWYGLGVVFKNREAMDVRMHYVADRQDGLENILDLLNKMEKASISREGNKIVVE